MPATALELQQDGPEMSTSKICIAYDGPGLQDGRMDVRDFAPAVLSLAAAFQESNKILSGGNAAVKVLVRADFRPGSFEISLDVVMTWGTMLLALFSGERASGAANLIEILGFSKTLLGETVFSIIKRIKGRPITEIKYLDSKLAQISIEGEHLIVRKPVAELLRDPKVRQAIYETLLPLANEEIDTFEVRDPEPTDGRNKVILQEVSREDLMYFLPPAPDDQLITHVLPPQSRQVMLTILSPNFKEGNKWKFSDGQSSITATIGDKSFMEDVNMRRISFSKDDVLTCELLTSQSASSTGIKTEHEITRVINLRHGMKQLALPTTGNHDD